MGWWPFGRKEKEKERERIDLQEERKILRLDFDRKRYEEELKTIQSREELEREKLQTKILEEQLDRREILADLEENDEEPGHGGNFEDQALMALLSGVLLKGGQSTPAAVSEPSKPAPAVADSRTISPSPAGGLSFSLDQIEEIYKSLPPHKRALVDHAKPDQIKAFLKQNYPTITDETIQKTIWFIESKQKD